jgi:RNA polymerase sigma-70 factor (ECF subfamily)
MPCTTPARPTVLDPETGRWLSDLRASGAQHHDALSRLHAILVKAAGREASRRLDPLVSGVELADVVQQAADDALVSIIAKLDEFRGESRFTTWAYKFVVLEVASKLSRHRWRTKPTVASDQQAWAQLPDRFGFTPDEAVQQRELLHAVRTAVDDVLTPHQRRVFVAIVLNAVPLDVLVAELGTNRNALYKALFDARRKVKTHLVANGYMESE